jgi:hypothetical protein
MSFQLKTSTQKHRRIRLQPPNVEIVSGHDNLNKNLLISPTAVFSRMHIHRRDIQSQPNAVKIKAGAHGRSIDRR